MKVMIFTAICIVLALYVVGGDDGCRTICFHTNQMNERGVEVAMYDYAHYSELYYCLKSVILIPRIPPCTAGMGLTKFKARFPVHFYDVEPSSIKSGGQKMIDKAHELKCSFVYITKSGEKYSNPSYTSTISKSSNIPIGIHAVFTWDPHGQTYAGISSDVTGGHQDRAIVPYMVPATNMNEFQKLNGLRSQLGIDSKTLVLCRHGAKDSFNVKFVPDVIVELLQKYGPQQLQFVFMNTNNFFISSSPQQGQQQQQRRSRVNNFTTSHHPQVHFLPGSTNQTIKEEFFRTCNAMLHARNMGESFGLAIAEFSVHNLPVITFDSPHISREHIRILSKKKGFFYHNAPELKQIIETFITEGIPVGDYNAYQEFSPSRVMKQFVKVFLEPVFGQIPPSQTSALVKS